MEKSTKIEDLPDYESDQEEEYLEPYQAPPQVQSVKQSFDINKLKEFFIKNLKEVSILFIIVFLTNLDQMLPFLKSVPFLPSFNYRTNVLKSLIVSVSFYLGRYYLV
jgi:hypothetical protein